MLKLNKVSSNLKASEKLCQEEEMEESPHRKSWFWGSARLKESAEAFHSLHQSNHKRRVLTAGHHLQKLRDYTEGDHTAIKSGALRQMWQHQTASPILHHALFIMFSITLPWYRWQVLILMGKKTIRCHRSSKLCESMSQPEGKTRRTTHQTVENSVFF